MRARSRSLLLAGLLLGALCSVQHAAAARSTSSARTLQQAEPASGKPAALPMGVKKQKPLSATEVMAMAAATGALLPACVPKYVSDLVIPPPMPVTTQPLTEAAARRHSKEAGAGRSLLAANIAEPAAVDRTRKRSSDSAVALAAVAASDNAAAAAAAEPQKEETVVKPKKVKEVYDIDDDYWGAIYTEPKADKKKKKSKAAAEEAPAPSPAPTPQDAAAAQPTPLPQEPLVDPTMPSYTGYDISIRQITQDVLPQAPHAPNTLPGCPAFFKQTDVLAYGPANVPDTPFHAWPAYTIEAQHTYETRVRWTNDLVDSNGNYIPHLLREAIDQTLTWANPSAVGGDTDTSPCAECKKTDSCKSDTTCKIAGSTTYNGPVPLVTHLHGQNGVADYSDGYPEAWYLPKAKNLLAYKNVGGWYQTFKREYASATGHRWNQGSFTAIYKNSERPGTQWFHDNTLGITRLNTYAGLSGFYFVRERFPSLANGPELPGLPYPAYDGTTDPLLVRELPLAIQDRAFTNESQLWYPVADHLENSSMPDSGVPPRSLPEFSATVTANGIPVNMVMMTVNGRTYPRQTVHPDAYRLRILNGCNTRTLQLRFARSNKPSMNPLSPIDGATLLPFYVVGNEGGFFPQIQPPMTTLQMGPGERYDLVVDFSSVMPGEFVYMLNNGPEPDTALYDGTNNGVGLTEHTAQVMRFDVVAMPPDVKPRPFTADEQCALNTAMKLHWEATSKPIDRTAPFVIKRLTLLDKTTPDGTPLIVQMGTADATRATATPWEQQVVNNAPMNTTQFWDVINLTPDAIPVHLHNSDFRFVGRWGVDVDPAQPHAFEDTDVPVTNPDLDPLLQVQCSFDASGRCAVPRDTMLMLPSTRTRIAFNAPTTQGLYTWNAQALEAQDNAMLAPYCAGTPLYIDPRRPGQRMCPQPPAK